MRVRPENVLDSNNVTKVSIHAPVRVRQHLIQFLLFHVVSIHAPVRVRPITSGGVFKAIRFNSRTREGATSVRSIFAILFRCFNSRTREGATFSQCSIYRKNSSFNSRTREGATTQSNQSKS